MLNEYGYNGDNSPVVCGSALRTLEDKHPEIGKESIKKLVQALDETKPLPERDTSGAYIMPVETAVSVPGRGTVVVGTVQQGKFNKGADAVLLGYGNSIKTQVSGMEVFNKSVTSAKAGDNVGILLRKSVKKLLREECQPESMQQFDNFEAQIYV